MSQIYQVNYEVDSEVIDYYDDIVNSNNPYIGIDHQFDLISMVDLPEDYIISNEIIKEPIQNKPVKNYNEQDFELVSIPGAPKSAAKIREHYYNLQEYGDNITLGKALEKGAVYVRAYYNDKNLRKRKA